MMAMAGMIAGLYAVAPRFAFWWTALFAVLSLALYTPSVLPQLANSYSVGAAIIAALAVAAYALLAVGEVPRRRAT